MEAELRQFVSVDDNACGEQEIPAGFFCAYTALDLTFPLHFDN